MASATNGTNYRRIVLVGISGDGKSATGNSILGYKAFESRPGFDACTLVCSRKQSCCQGKQLCYDVIDTPGLFDADIPFAGRALEILRVYEEFQEQPHVFLLVMDGSKRITDEDNRVMDVLHIIFGEDMFKHTIVVFTHGATYQDEVALSEAIQRSPAIKDIVRKCGHRVALIENNTKGYSPKDSQIEDLLNKIEDLSCQGRRSYKYGDVFIHKRVLEVYALKYKSTGDIDQECQDVIKVLREELSAAAWRRYAIGAAAGAGTVVLAAGVAIAAGPAPVAQALTTVVNAIPINEIGEMIYKNFGLH